MPKPTALTAEEKSVAKALLIGGMRNQDVHALLNFGRTVTINFGRISGIKKDKTIIPASMDDVELYKKRKECYDPSTKLSIFNDERIIRSRESMILAVSLFNNPSFKFKTELFSVLSNISWTYLMHEYYLRKGVNILVENGQTISLSQMINRNDCPLSKGAKNNIRSIKLIRDNVEHKLFGQSDQNWLPLFQACCLNYDKYISLFFGKEKSLCKELSLALQFSKLDLEQASITQKYDIPSEMSALDALLNAELTEEDLSDIEYKFRVVYTLDSASKGNSHFHFVNPQSEEGKNIHNVLQKFKIADDIYKYKPGDVVRLVKSKGNKTFTIHHHTIAWRHYKARPDSGSNTPEKTDRKYCIYHAAHKDYTYNDEWVNLLSVL